jgi:hypothetical protein
LWVTIESAQDVEGKKQTNPYVEVVLKGEKKKTKVYSLMDCNVDTDSPARNIVVPAHCCWQRHFNLHLYLNVKWLGKRIQKACLL